MGALVTYLCVEDVRPPGVGWGRNQGSSFSLAEFEATEDAEAQSIPLQPQSPGSRKAGDAYRTMLRLTDGDSTSSAESSPELRPTAAPPGPWPGSD